MNIKPITESLGKGKPVVALIAAMHGNEKVGIEVFGRLKKRIKVTKGTLKFIIANPVALKNNKRYIESDLNRIFPGNPEGDLENQLACQLLNEIKDTNFVLDLHSCSIESKPFCIIRDKRNLKFSLKTGLSHFVLYPLDEQGGKSLIDFAKYGTGLELGKHDKEKTIQAGVNSVLNFISALDMTNKKFKCSKRIKTYQIIGKIKKDVHTIPSLKIKNFIHVKKGTILAKRKNKLIYALEDFYPILFGEKAYSDTLCLKGKKLNLSV